MNYLSILFALRTRSMRRGIWYKVLNVLERAQVDLTVRVVQRVRSPLLAKVLDAIITKLSVCLESEVSSRIKSVGLPLAFKLSRIAEGWGYEPARAWAEDLKFAKFLAVMSLNSDALALRKRGP